jgi:hypothetical protein
MVVLLLDELRSILICLLAIVRREAAGEKDDRTQKWGSEQAPAAG